MSPDTVDTFFFHSLILPVTAAICAGLIYLLRPLLQRYAIARPNARSSHTTPTPQGGGIAVIGATIVVVAGVVSWFSIAGAHDAIRLAAVLAAATALAVVGAYDDIRPIEVLPRLLLQAVAIIVVLAALPTELRVVPSLPWWVERALMLVAILWFVNLVNFMDGIDWMTAAQIVPVTAALFVFGVTGALPAEATVLAVAV